MPKKIVIVDDDAGLRDVAQLIFERAGYHTVVISSAHSLYEGLHLDADLILLDRHLSGMDGLDVCRDLKQKPVFAHVPILLMSATRHFSESEQHIPADGFIEKPFRKNELLQRVADAIAPVI